MNLKESISASCVGGQVFMNYVDDSPLCTVDESCNISIKEELLDITECSLNDFKSEIEDFNVNIKDEPLLEEDKNSASDNFELNIDNIIGKTVSSIVKKSLSNITNNKVPVTRKLIIDGQEKTCILVKNPSWKDAIMEGFPRARETINNAPSLNKDLFNKSVVNSMVTSPDKSHLSDHTYSLSRNTESFMVTCSRCFWGVHVDNFNQHIKSCVSRKASCDEANGHKIMSANQTVQTIYNPFTGKVALNDHMNTSNSCNKNADISNLKSGQGLRLDNNRSHNSYFRNKSPTKDNNLKNTSLKTHLSFSSYNEQLQKNNLLRVRRCKLCSYVTRNQKYFKVHKMCHVKKMPIIQCNKCGFKSTKHILEDHKRKHRSVADRHSTEGSLLLEDNTISCSICSFTTDEQQLLKDHERRHRRPNVRIFQCFYCGQRYTRYMLYFHIQNIHPGQRFLIGNQRSFKVPTKRSVESSISYLPTTEGNNVEKRVSGNAEEFPQFKTIQNCSLCSFSTIDYVTLKLHLRQHQFEPIERKTVFGKIQYDCKICSYSRSRFSEVYVHVNSHRKNLPIRKCPECDFRSTRQALRHHIRKCKNKNEPKKNREL